MESVAPAPPARARLIAEALAFARAASRLPGVTRIALLGSLTTEKPNPKDVDLLVTVADGADPAANYLGRTCPWKDCRPGLRLRCDALHCGRRAFLHDDLATVELPRRLVAAPPVELWPAIVVRAPIPADLERSLAELRRV